MPERQIPEEFNQHLEAVKTPEQGERIFNIHLGNIEITPEKPFEFKVKVTKHPIELCSGDKLGMNNTEVRFEGQMTELQQEAQGLKDLPERERIQALLGLVRSKIKYPYPEVIEQAAKDHPELGEWLNAKFGLSSVQFMRINVNDCLDRGYGDCKILASAYLGAAKSAGLKGTYQEIGTGLKNLRRPDNGQPIFKMTEVEKDVGMSHAWVDMQLENDEWVPVDISANMAATTPEMKAFFQQANYRTNIGGSFEVLDLPKGIKVSWRGETLPSGEGTGEATLAIEINRTLVLGSKEPPKPQIPEFKGNLDLRLKVADNPKVMNLEIELIK